MSEPNECPRLIEAQRLWDREIDPARVGDVRQHVAHCPSCRAASDEWERLSALLARGDPAAPLAPERQRRMKAAILAECTASLDADAGAAHPCRTPNSKAVQSTAMAPAQARRQPALAGFFPCRQGASAPGPRPCAPYLNRIAPIPDGWRRLLPLRVAMPLLLLAALLLVHARRPVPRGQFHPATEVGRVPPAPSQKPTKPSRGQTIAHRLDAAPPPPRLKVYRRTPKRFRRAARRRSIPLAAAWLGRSARHRTDPPTLVVGRVRQARVAAVPLRAERAPIQRLVIQADGPAVRTRSVTHITVIAAGDLEGPGAQLTIIESRREETLP